jgi:FKBP-type peptidyl-prolyl cis-trans isomerase SlyD
MKITANMVVTVKYKLMDAQNNLIDEGREPLVYLHGGYGNVLEKIEETLEGKGEGFSTTIQIEPEEGFGDYDASLVKIEPRDRLPTPLEVGMQFEGISNEENGAEDSLIFTVTDITEDKVVLDGNHPLAGMALRFFLEVESVRLATEEEVAHGHVHEAGDGESDFDAYRSHTLQ